VQEAANRGILGLRISLQSNKGTMEPIKLRTWITWALILFALGLLADYFFLHLLFHEKNNAKKEVITAPVTPGATVAPAHTPDETFIADNENEAESEAESRSKDNFLESLQKCAPEVAAQAIATPEALMEYLKKSVGVSKDEISLENYHLTLPDGSKRRVHVVIADNTNSPDKKEIRLFKLDAEGYPERLKLRGDETLESLLAMGTVTRHEAKSELLLKDGSTVSLEMHDKKVFEFQYNNHGKVLSCRFKDCQCP